MTQETMTIDGLGNEAIWASATWYPIDQTWIGTPPSATDFSGRFKVLWDQGYLYLLTEITDEELSDDHAAPLTNWWDDDGIEILIDADFSKGNHQYNYNAFAYHVSTFYDVVDLGTDQQPHLYNDHITTVMTQAGDLYTWECKLKVFDDTFVYGGTNAPLSLTANQTLGLSMSYNDNDAGTSRENFMGSGVVPGADKNVGYITADYFQQLTLVENTVSSRSQDQPLGLVLYPNPASGLVQVELPLQPWQRLEVFTPTGKKLFTQQLAGLQAVQLNVSDYPAGIYLVQVVGAYVATQRLRVHSE
jgi:hypothetical protein